LAFLFKVIITMYGTMNLKFIEYQSEILWNDTKNRFKNRLTVIIQCKINADAKKKAISLEAWTGP